MKKIKTLITMLLAGLLTVNISASNLDSNNQATQLTQETKSDFTDEILDKTVWKTTIFKNPKIINGKTYLTKEQLEKALEVKVNENVTGGNKGAYANVYQKNRVIGCDKWSSRISMNGMQFEFLSKNNPIIIKDKVKYYNAEFYAKYFNSTISYDSNTKTLTVNNLGLVEPVAINPERNNIIQGYVYDLEGNPVENVRVTVIAVKAENNEGKSREQIFEIRPIVYTDKEGHFEFEAIDTEKYPYVQVESYLELDGKKYYGGAQEELLADGSSTVGGYCYSSSKYTDYSSYLFEAGK